MTPDQLQQRMATGEAPLIIDVRTPFEFARGHIEGSRNLPYWKIYREGRKLAEERKPIILCCEHGPRAWLAGGILRLYALDNVDYLDGHMARWKREGRPLAVG